MSDSCLLSLLVLKARVKVLTSRGSKMARRILSFPTPVIGVSTGHCIAMGAFLMLACDYRIGAAGDFKVGLNETIIGMTMHNFGIELLATVCL